MASVEEIADAMFEVVSEAAGSKKYKPGDLTKMMKERFGAPKKDCKEAIKQLINSGKCVYTYFGGSYIELPHREASAND